MTYTHMIANTDFVSQYWSCSSNKDGKKQHFCSYKHTCSNKDTPKLFPKKLEISAYHFSGKFCKKSYFLCIFSQVLQQLLDQMISSSTSCTTTSAKHILTLTTLDTSPSAIRPTLQAHTERGCQFLAPRLPIHSANGTGIMRALIMR